MFKNKISLSAESNHASIYVNLLSGQTLSGMIIVAKFGYFAINQSKSSSHGNVIVIYACFEKRRLVFFWLHLREKHKSQLN